MSRLLISTFRISRGGASAVEFAIVAPVFLAVLLGTLTFGWSFAMIHSVQQLASEAARASVAGLDDTERSALARAFVEQQSSGLVLLEPRRLRVVAQRAENDANVFRVSVTYDLTGHLINDVSRMVGFDMTSIERTSSVRRGGF